MRPVKIFTDSTSDLTAEILKEFQIAIVPLYVTFDKQAFRDGLDLTTEMLYELVEQLGQLPKTAAPTPLDFRDAFRPWIDSGHDIVYISLSAQISSTWQNARIAAAEFPPGRIHIIDSQNLSTGIGLLVLKACDHVLEGLAADEIAARIREYVPRVRTAFVIDTLDYLYKGGRCSAVQNFMSSLLRIRPIVKVVDGKMILGQKLRGPRQHALNHMLQEVLDNQAIIDPQRIIVTHSQGYADALYLKEQLEQTFQDCQVILTDAGCVISSHCGPKTVGIIYLEK